MRTNNCDDIDREEQLCKLKERVTSTRKRNYKCLCSMQLALLFGKFIHFSSCNFPLVNISSSIMLFIMTYYIVESIYILS